MIMVLGMLMACLVPAHAQSNIDQWQSTSAMQTSGSAYSPQVTTVGATAVPSEATTTGASYSPGRPGTIKRGFDTGGETGKSEESPVGDAVLPLMLMALVFCGVIALRRKRNAMTNG